FSYKPVSADDKHIDKSLSVIESTYRHLTRDRYEDYFMSPEIITRSYNVFNGEVFSYVSLKEYLKYFDRNCKPPKPLVFLPLQQHKFIYFLWKAERECEIEGSRDLFQSRLEVEKDLMKSEISRRRKCGWKGLETVRRIEIDDFFK